MSCVSLYSSTLLIQPQRTRETPLAQCTSTCSLMKMPQLDKTSLHVQMFRKRLPYKRVGNNAETVSGPDWSPTCQRYP